MAGESVPSAPNPQRLAQFEWDIIEKHIASPFPKVQGSPVGVAAGILTQVLVESLACLQTCFKWSRPRGIHIATLCELIQRFEMDRIKLLQVMEMGAATALAGVNDPMGVRTSPDEPPMRSYSEAALFVAHEFYLCCLGTTQPSAIINDKSDPGPRLDPEACIDHWQELAEAGQKILRNVDGLRLAVRREVVKAHIASKRAKLTPPQEMPPNGEDAEPKGTAGEADKPKRGRRKGSVASDPKRDRQIVEAWAKGFGEFASLEALASEFRIDKADVVAALDRHRKRLAEPETIRAGKSRQGQ